MIWTDNMIIPTGGSVATASTYMNSVYDPKVAAQIAAYVAYVPPVKGTQEELAKIDPELAKNPLVFPSDARPCQGASVRLGGAQQRDVHRAVAEGARGLRAREGVSFFHRHRGLTPYLLLLPGLLWLVLFFLAPLGFLGYQSLESGSFDTGYSFDWAFSNYWDAISTYHEQFVRSFLYAGIATLLALGIGYPLVYWIAFRAGRWKNVFLILIVAPLFVTYLVRTLAWLNILSDEGPVVGFLREHSRARCRRPPARDVGRRGGRHHLQLPAVHGAAPVRVARADRSAPARSGEDLYASKRQAFLRVTLPLSAPGIVAGTLLTFIPAAGDFINAQLLGTPRQYMIGNVIQSKFLELIDYPAAASLSFILMALILVALLVYARAVGTERLTG